MSNEQPYTNGTIVIDPHGDRARIKRNFRYNKESGLIGLAYVIEYIDWPRAVFRSTSMTSYAHHDLVVESIAAVSVTRVKELI